MIEQLITSCPKELDLTNATHAQLIYEAVTSILQEDYPISEIEAIESRLIRQNNPEHIFVLQALKLAKSKILVGQITEPLMISVVFAVYKEHNRIRKNSEHPHGEDFLLKKVKQLEWLFKDQPQVQWELLIVDDGCPEKSGEIAQGIIEANQLNKQVRVLYLHEAIKKSYPPAASIASTNESQKGGSIVYGMWDAVQKSTNSNQIVIYTDADLSTHLGQLMLLINPLLKKGNLVAIGSRREPTSVVIKKGSRNDRGKLFIYLWKRLIPNLGDIIDTQCGFKAFRAEIVPDIIDNMIEKKFAFDIELLLRTALINQDAIIKVPIAWIDSEAASTTTDLQPYLPMLKSITRMYRKYFPREAGAEEFADFIEAMDDQAFAVLLDNIPENITRREPLEFTEYDQVRVLELKTK
ncbi:MAG: hypothetical protein HKP60_11860 [Eudoraea sp.]|nr:hypothetical protein [Eudoraea sp.]NNJ41556.1 hypothetical protein [Eudoraea sp.]